MSYKFFRVLLIGAFCLTSIVALSTVLPTLAASSIMRSAPLRGNHVQSKTTINTGDTVLLIHGVNEDCGVWNNTAQYLQGTHTIDGQQIQWTGSILSIGYYSSAGDTNNCSLNFYGLGFPHCKGYYAANLGTNNESIEHLACELAWYIYTSYTQHNLNVEIVTHSMGGLITRLAIACSTASTTKATLCTSPSNTNPFPDAQLLVRDAVDFDTPNGGIPYKLLSVGAFGITLGGLLGCTQNAQGAWICPREVRQMLVGSSFLTDLDSNAQNPQGALGTSWTMMGVKKGTACLSLPPGNSTYMDGGNKILYIYPCYSHISIPILKDFAMMDDPPPTDTLDGVVQYCTNCPKTPSSWQNSSAYPHALLNMLYAITELPILPNGANLVVNTSADLASPCASNAYSLRCAIAQANSDGQGDTIQFNIPSSDPGCQLTTIRGKTVSVCTISPTSGFPFLIASNTLIDGYSQPGAQKNTLSLGKGDNAILTIRIDGTNGGGLAVGGFGNISNDILQGLEVTNMNPYGILVYTTSVTNIIIRGNFVGTDGTNTFGNGTGIYIASGSSNNEIGGETPDSANLISGNSGQGITIGAGSGNTIEGNYIGTNSSGKTALRTGLNRNIPNPLASRGLPNGAGIAVFANATNNLIGGITPASDNIIAHNTYGITSEGGSTTSIIGNTISSNYVGVRVDNGETGDSISQNTINNNVNAGIQIGNSSTDSSHAFILANKIFLNGGLGIDLYPIGTVNCTGPTPGTPNDYTPCPVIQIATTTQVSGTACAGCYVEVYIATNEADDQGYGEGQTFINNTTADSNGNWSVSSSLTIGTQVTATATTPSSPGPEETSEFAANIVVSS